MEYPRTIIFDMKSVSNVLFRSLTAAINSSRSHTTDTVGCDEPESNKASNRSASASEGFPSWVQ